MKFLDYAIFFVVRQLILVVLWFWFSCPVFSALAATNALVPYSSRTWQTDEGLPQNAVQALAQTRDGYLWVGTSRGLARFDGVRFTTFDPRNTPAIEHVSITALCPNRDGSLWIGTGGGGLTQFREGRFIHYSLGKNPQGNNIKCILEGRDGVLWVGTVGGLFRLQQGAWTHFTVQEGLRDNVVRSLCEVGDQLWIGTGSGLNVWRNGVISVQSGLENKSVRAVFEDSKGNLWLGLTSGLACLTEGQVTLYNKRDGLPDENVTALYEDRRGTLWIGTYGGLSRWRDGRLVVEKDSQGGFYDQVNALLEDREGDLWVGGRDGLHQLRVKRFLAYTRQQGLTHNNVTSVLEDHSGSLWIGTWGGGLDRWKNEAMTGYAREIGGSNALGSDLVLALCEDRDGSLLIGTDYEGGVFRLSAGKCTCLWNREQALANRVIRVIHRDRQGNLWFGLSPGLLLWNTREKFLERATIHCILEDAAGTLWVGSNDGLFRRQDGKFIRITVPGGLGHDTVSALFEDRERSLWIGTEGNGLRRYQEGRLTAYTTHQGLWSDEIFEILEDDYGWLWLSCPKGIFRVFKRNMEEFDRNETPVIASIAYGKADGMESLQCSGVAKPGAWRSRDGRLWFATTKGVVVTDPNSGLGLNEPPPPVRIEEVLADKHLLGLPEHEPLRIVPGRGELEFHYTALSFPAPENNRFRYKLEGADPEWVEAGGRRVAYYNNLRPGRYRFRVLACNNDAVWNLAGAELAVTLLPHLWQSWWFTGFAAVAMVGVIGGTVRYATRRKMQRKLERLEQQNAIEKERSRIAQDMHDDLGAQLTEILLLNELANKNKTNPCELETHLSKQAHVIQDVAGSLDTIVWAVNPVNDSIDRLANYLYEQVERILTISSIRCRFDVPDELPDYFLSSEVRNHVFLVVREALNNVIKHSDASEVWFRLRASSGALSFAIEDNGKGFLTANHSAFGNGLQNMARRMKNLGGSFRLWSQPGKGTQIQVEVPIKVVPDQ